MSGLLNNSCDGPISVYLHIPFCVSKCPYCAFYSMSAAGQYIDPFIDALERELSWWKLSFPGDRIQVRTLYIGGGTPTVLSVGQWKRLLSILDDSFNFVTGCEISVEANPDSLIYEHLNLWKDFGLTRVSLGVQSLFDEDLKWLGRPHDADTAKKALAAIREKGFDLSADLLFGIAGQDLRKWYDLLNEILNFDPDHLSIYQLMLEEGSRWGTSAPEGVFNGYPEYRLAQWFLPAKGLDQYEVASFAKPGKWCKHNIAYWYQKNVLALGPSAWGYLSGVRYCNNGNLSDYIRKAGSAEGNVSYYEELDDEARLREAMILSTRTKWGFLPANLCRSFSTGIFDKIIGGVHDLPESLFTRDGSRIAFSRKGMRLGNVVWERIV